MNFPKDFVWGAATSSYQIEGAAQEDGRGECIWTRFSHTEGKVANGDTGNVACDHYHRYAEDLDLMASLKLNSYRFSTSWARIIPRLGEVNNAGLDFYDRLVDGLLERGIRPFLTLYHWDLPQALHDLGGWPSPDVAGWFRDYTAVVVERLGDRVMDWITINEPWVVAFVGHFQGRHAPGIQDFPTALKAAHHTLLAHQNAVEVLRNHNAEFNIGITLDHPLKEPASDRPEDVAAARREDGYHNRWFFDPVFKGQYPADMLELYANDMQGIDTAELKAPPIDFVGINYYTRNRMIDSPDNPPNFNRSLPPPSGSTITDMNWEVYPQGLYKALKRIQQDYAPPSIYVTENGAAFPDEMAADGSIEDDLRVDYLRSHLTAVSEAIAVGVPVDGYFAWSLFDNFEWAHGYKMRFGIVHVDFETLKRTPKRSAFYYRNLIEVARSPHVD